VVQTEYMLSEPIRASIEVPSISLAGVTSPISTLAALQKNGNDHEEAGEEPRRGTNQASSDVAKTDMIVGVWSPEGGACSARDFQPGLLPAIISTDGAWAGDTFCVFKKKQQTESGWRVVAECSSPRERWTSNVRLSVNGNRLVWASQRGTQAYARCANDIMTAQAR
jgi:hypothetical protein